MDHIEVIAVTETSETITQRQMQSETVKTTDLLSPVSFHLLDPSSSERWVQIRLREAVGLSFSNEAALKFQRSYLQSPCRFGGMIVMATWWVWVEETAGMRKLC